jgi:hypothetical protein
MRDRVVCLVLLALAVSTPDAFAQSDGVTRDGDHVIVRLLIGGNRPCTQQPRWNAEPGAPEGSEIPPGAVSFMAKLDPGKCPGRTMAIHDLKLRLPVPTNATTLIVYVPERATEGPYQPRRYDLRPLDPAKPPSPATERPVGDTRQPVR